MRKPRVVVVGLDAATFSVIDPMLEAGQLPVLARLFEAGTKGILRSTTHPLTTQAWTTMLTGVNAGRHGMWDFTERDESGYRLRLVNGSFRQAPAVWDYLSAAGRTVGIVNVPFSWPAPKVQGFSIAGIDASAREFGMTYPQELLSELTARYGHLELDHGLALNGDGYIQVDKVRAAVEQRVDAVLWLAERFQPELLVTVFMAADHMQHYGWVEWEEKGLESRVAEVYRILDQAVGRLIEPFEGDADIVVVSDHGAGRMKGVVNVNAWLAEHGFLAYADTRSMVRQGEVPRILLNKLLEARRRLPKSVRHFAKQKAPKFRERVYQLREFTAIDFRHTKAFAYGTMGSVVINVRGREKHGVVEPGEEYERVRDEIAARALELVDPKTGEAIIRAVHRREDLFHGPAIDKIPDLVFEFAEYAWAGKGNLARRTASMWDDTIKMAGAGNETYVGTHRHEGIIGLAGPSIRAGDAVSASIEDVAPTLLYLLGEQIPVELEGRLLAETMRPELLDSRPPEYGEPREIHLQEEQLYNAEEVEAVEGRLRDLGYLE